MAFLLGMTSMVSAQQTAEKLNRAPVAVKTAKGILVSWRSLNTDAASTSFSVYRNGTQIASAISTKTNYLDADGNALTLGPAGMYDVLKDTGYALYWDTVNYASYCVFTNNGNKFHVEFPLAQPSTGKLFLGGLFEFEWNR